MFFNQSFWVAIALYASSAASFIFFIVGAIFFAISSFIFFIGGAIFFSRCWIKRLFVHIRVAWRSFRFMFSSCIVTRLEMGQTSESADVR